MHGHPRSCNARTMHGAVRHSHQSLARAARWQRGRRGCRARRPRQDPAPLQQAMHAHFQQTTLQHSAALRRMCIAPASVMLSPTQTWLLSGCLYDSMQHKGMLYSCVLLMFCAHKACMRTRRHGGGPLRRQQMVVPRARAEEVHRVAHDQPRALQAHPGSRPAAHPSSRRRLTSSALCRRRQRLAQAIAVDLAPCDI